MIKLLHLNLYLTDGGYTVHTSRKSSSNSDNWADSWELWKSNWNSDLKDQSFMNYVCYVVILFSHKMPFSAPSIAFFTIVREDILLCWQNNHILHINYYYFLYLNSILLFVWGWMSWLWHCKTYFFIQQTISIFLLQTLLAFIYEIYAISEQVRPFIKTIA